MISTNTIKFLILVVFLTTVSCEKNDVHIEGRYKTSSITEVGQVIMYTNQGQVSHVPIIKDFLARKNTPNFFVFDKKSEVTNDYLSTFLIDFESDGIMVYTSTRNTSTPSQGEIVTQTSTYIDIAGIDSVEFMHAHPWNWNDRCQTLASGLTNPIPPKKEYHIPSTSGYNSFYKFRPMLRIEIQKGQLFLPLVAQTVSYTNPNNGSYCYSASYGGFGTFNKDILKQLQPGDTIVYQSKRVKLIKQ